MTRTISTNALALRYALGCEIAPLRDAALAHALDVIYAESGHAGRIAAALGLDRRTYSRLREDFPALADAHERARGKNDTDPEIGSRQSGTGAAL